MKSGRFFILLVVFGSLLLQACGASGDAVATDIAATIQVSGLQTAAAQAALITDTATPSETVAAPTVTETATNTATVTDTLQPTMTDTPKGPAPEDFSGHWFTNFGTMDIIQNDRSFTGTYYDAFYSNTGSFSGSISGHQLTGADDNSGSPVSLFLGSNGITFSGTGVANEAWCGAQPGHHFPEGCSFSGQWFTQREPSGQCDDNPFTLVRIDNTVSGVYCGNRTINGTLSYPGNGQAVIFTGTILANDLATYRPLHFKLSGYDSLQFQGDWNDQFEFCGWRASSSEPSPCYWP